MYYPARLILTAALMGLSWAGCGSGIPEGDSRVRSDGDVVRVSLGEIGEKRGDYFNYTTSSGSRVDFLVYRETSGSYRAVLDGLDPIAREGGFAQFHSYRDRGFVGAYDLPFEHAAIFEGDPVGKRCR